MNLLRERRRNPSVNMGEVTNQIFGEPTQLCQTEKAAELQGITDEVGSHLRCGRLFDRSGKSAFSASYCPDPFRTSAFFCAQNS